MEYEIDFIKWKWLITKSITDLVIGKQGNIYIATYQQGLVVYDIDKNKFVEYQSVDFLPKASGGDGSLNVYRKITLQTQDVLFEKIYLKQSEYYNKLEIFYIKILPQINHLIKAPKLEYIHKITFLAFLLPSLFFLLVDYICFLIFL